MVARTTEQNSEHQLITRLFDNQPDAVIWFIPKFTGNEKTVPEDFIVGYCNHSACNLLKSTKHDLTGANLLSSSLIDDQTRQHVLEQCLEIWKTGMYAEFTY